MCNADGKIPSNTVLNEYPHGHVKELAHEPRVSKTLPWAGLNPLDWHLKRVERYDPPMFKNFRLIDSSTDTALFCTFKVCINPSLTTVR
jgi:hypothetical protein